VTSSTPSTSRPGLNDHQRIRHGITATDLRDTIYTHPSSAEGFNEVLAGSSSDTTSPHREQNTMSTTTQTTEHDPAALFAVAEEFRAAQLAGDRARLRTVLSEDVTWVLAGDNTVSGEARGVDEVFARFDQLAHYGVHIDIEHITIGRDGAALIMHNTGEHDGRILDEHLVSTMAVTDGRIVRIDTHLSDLDMMNAYFI
jgi:ketosteroid isomerase-like protein